MDKHIICEGDVFTCTEGMLSCKMNVTSQHEVTIQGKKIATKNDAAINNLSGFGKCRTMQNPLVAAATAAANGVLQPQKCIPVFINGWNNTKNAEINGISILNVNSVIKCVYGGRITVREIGQKKVNN